MEIVDVGRGTLLIYFAVGQYLVHFIVFSPVAHRGVCLALVENPEPTVSMVS